MFLLGAICHKFVLSEFCFKMKYLFDINFRGSLEEVFKGKMSTNVMRVETVSLNLENEIFVHTADIKSVSLLECQKQVS